LKLGGKKLFATDSAGMGIILVIFSSTMFFGAFFAWAWLPEVQSAQRLSKSWVLPSKSLEDLGEGRRRAEYGQALGLRNRIKALFE
jgi:MFS transporter, PHS family, inorganic phosphate transporter